VALNPAVRGREYPAVTLTVDRDHVVRFAEAVGEESPLVRDPEAARAAGYPEQLAPPTFVATLQFGATAQVVADPELGLDYTRVVHGEQEFEWRRPVHVGEVLSAVPKVAEVYARGPHEFLVIEVEVRAASGETVVTSRSTLISRGTAARG
jgi:acyl dehydratase